MVRTVTEQEILLQSCSSFMLVATVKRLFTRPQRHGVSAQGLGAAPLVSPLRHFQLLAVGVFLIGVVFLAAWQLFNYWHSIFASSATTGTWRQWCATQPINALAWQDANDPRYSVYGTSFTLGSSAAPYLITTACELASLHQDIAPNQRTDPSLRPYAGKWFKLSPASGKGILDLSAHLWEPINIYGSESGTVFDDDAIVHFDGQIAPGQNATISGLVLANNFRSAIYSTGLSDSTYRGSAQEPISQQCTPAPGEALSDSQCSENESFSAAGVVGLFGETYKTWIGNLDLSQPQITVATASGVQLENQSLTSSTNNLPAADSKCLQARGRLEQLCLDYGGCPARLDEAKALVESLDWELLGEAHCDLDPTYGDGNCRYHYVDAQGGHNEARVKLATGGVAVEVELRLHLPYGSAGELMMVERGCSETGCSQRFQISLAGTPSFDFQAQCRAGGRCEYTDLLASESFTCHGYQGVDHIGALVGLSRFTRAQNVNVIEPKLKVSNLMPGFSVGGLIGMANGWTYITSSSVVGGEIEVQEMPADYVVEQVFSHTVGGMVGVLYKSVITNGLTSSEIKYQLSDAALTTLREICLNNIYCRLVDFKGVLLAVGGLAGVAEAAGENPIYGVSTCILNSYSRVNFNLQSDILPRFEMTTPQFTNTWVDEMNGVYELGEAEPLFMVGGIAGYINDTIVNNYYLGTLQVKPYSSPAQMRTNLDTGRGVVRRTVRPESWERLDEEQVEQWRDGVQNWQQQGSDFPGHSPQP
jgi:hypothetical protein